jgi:glycerol-3-phosphate O-acyltransferase
LVSGESTSQVLFKSALSLARNRDLIDDSQGIEERRRAFAAEIRAARDRATLGL